MKLYSNRGISLEATSVRKAIHVASCLELAILLESSAHKPGNVSIVTNFESTRYEHFLASAVAATPYFVSAASRGIAVSEGNMRVDRVGIGQIIRDCVSRIQAWQHGGNTLLGTVILLVPIAVGAGMSCDEENVLDKRKLRQNLKQIVESTTPQDAVALYEGIRIANPGGLGKVPNLDVNSPDSSREILDKGISLYQIFKIASPYDRICSEWVENYKITFDFCYPYFSEQIKKTNDVSKAIIQTFLKVLATYPDTFIARKVGFDRAKEVSLEAAQIVRLGGLETSIGRQSLSKFDDELRQQSNLLNPGTTADITAAALTLSVLGGYRP